MLADNAHFCITRHLLTRSSSVFIRSASHIASRHSSSSSTSAQNCGMFWWTHSIKVAVSTGAVLSRSCNGGVRQENRMTGVRRSPRNRSRIAAENVDVDDWVADSWPNIPPPWLSPERCRRHPRSFRRFLLGGMSSNTLQVLVSTTYVCCTGPCRARGTSPSFALGGQSDSTYLTI